MTHKIILTPLFSFALFLTSSAHALWIEAGPVGEIGKSHAVKIFYGEYAAKEFEKTDNWYSDVNTFVLWLIAPDGQKEQLTYSAAGNHYETSFTPDQKGTYVLVTSHTAAEVSRGYVYQFNASASVEVGKAAIHAQTIGASELYLQAEKSPKGKSALVKAYYKGQPAVEIDVTVTGPTGWSKTFKTNKRGVVQFEPLWEEGAYALEGFYTTEETGTRNEVDYDHIWRCATTRIAFN